jgi:ribosomal protein S18 acetylase RimI-like enzyme
MSESSLRLEPYTVESAFLNEIVDVYVQVFQEEWQLSYDFITRYATTYPDFRGLVALLGRHVIGMGFGTRFVAGNWWCDKVAAQVGAGHPALQDAWVLVQLGVLVSYRGEGIGSMLLTRLLELQPCPRTLLSTQVANTGARRLYERHGWQYLHPGFVFAEGQEPFVVMHKELKKEK